MDSKRWIQYSCMLCRRILPYFSMILLQFAYSGMNIISKTALNQGLSPFILSVYRHSIAALVLCPLAIFFERTALSNLKPSICFKIIILGCLEPVLDQDLFFLGMKHTSATFASTMTNLLPAITFILAWILRLERVKLKEGRSIAKVIGTLISISGAMMMTLYKGRAIKTPWSANPSNQREEATTQNIAKGSFFLVVSSSCWASFVILQTITLRSFPSELTVAALVCLAGAVEGAAVSLVAEGKNFHAWNVGWGMKFIVAVYGALFCSAMGYCLQGFVTKKRGPVFVTAFSPLGMVIVAAAGLILLREDLFLGRIIGAMFIVLGLYMVVWGKSRDEEVGLNQDEEEQVLELRGGALPA